MKRKLIKQGGGGLTFYVPKKWIDNKRLKPGDEIEIRTEEDNLIISPGPSSLQKKAEINIKGMDRNAFIKTITAYYENGFSEIKINFEKNTIYDPWKKQSSSLRKEVEFLVSRLIGFEIISSKKDQYILKDVAMTSADEFKNVLRRIFLLILDYQDIVKEAINSNQPIKNNEDLHDNITKFVSFCLRLLNLNLEKTNVEKNNLHTILTLLDKVTDCIRYLARDYKKIKEKKTIFDLMEHFRKYYNFFYNYDLKLVNELDIERNKLKSKETTFSEMLEYVQAMIKPRICLSIS